MKRLALLITALTLLANLHAQVTIGSSSKPVAGAILDLKETDAGASKRGLGLPRVNLSKIDQLFPMFGTTGNVTGGYDTQKTTLDQEHLGLIVYNMHTDLDEGLCPGVYAWIGEQWIRIPDPCTPARTIESSPNSYIVSPGTSVEIPVGKPYLVAQKRTDLTKLNLTDKVTLELLWQDTQNLIDKLELVDGDNGPYSKFKVTTKTGGATGNAVVAVRMGANGNNSDPIVWSWHIWVTNYNPNSNTNGTTYAHNNGAKDYVFMDRNLGALSTSSTDNNTLGLIYQWGRKDPFTAAKALASDVGNKQLYDISNSLLTEYNEPATGHTGTGMNYVMVSNAGTTNNLGYSLAHPNTFLYGKYETTYKTLDWFTTNESSTSGDDALWGASQAKSDFDPCPEGWRVPDYASDKSPWAKFEGVSNGWDPPISNYVQKDATNNGSNLIDGLPSVTKLGFYPYANYRRPRMINIAIFVGQGEELLVGGAFYDSGMIDASARESQFWTAKPTSGSNNAKAFTIYDQGSSMPGEDGRASVIIDSSRGTGASVRCVKDN